MRGLLLVCLALLLPECREAPGQRGGAGGAAPAGAVQGELSQAASRADRVEGAMHPCRWEESCRVPCAGPRCCAGWWVCPDEESDTLARRPRAKAGGKPGRPALLR